MKGWKVATVALLAVSLTGVLLAEGAETKDDTQPQRPGPVVRAWGRVKELSEDLSKIAIEVQEDVDKEPEIMIFKIEKDTRIIKGVDPKGVKDLGKGLEVVIGYRAVKDKKETPGAIFIRILEDNDPLRPRPRAPRPRRP